MPERDDAEMKGKITEDDVQRYRNRIGVLIPDSPPFNHEAHKDTIRHFANCYGDDNPLFCDEDYAKDTRWGGIIAPPQYIITLERTTVPPSRRRSARPAQAPSAASPTTSPAATTSGSAPSCPATRFG